MMRVVIFGKSFLAISITVIFSLASCTPATYSNRIIGGSLAKEGQFPFQVALQLEDRRHICGAVLLSARWVLTAKHCTENYDVKNVKAAVGSLKRTEGTPYDLEKEMFYEEDGYDLVLLKTEKPIEFNNFVKPIVIHSEYIGANMQVIGSGWGMTNYPGGEKSDDLRHVTVKTISNDECKKLYNGTPIDPWEICTVAPEMDGVTRGDSGGPLTLNGELVGIVSWSARGRRKPDVFVRVSEMRKWIEGAMKDN